MKLKSYFKDLYWRHILSGISDSLATQRISGLVADGPYLSWSDSALSATAVATVLNDISVNRRLNIVECGGGISSIFIGRLLKQRERAEGRLSVIEHDKEWLGVLRAMVASFDIEPWVALIHAPLCQTDLSWDEELWYDTDVLKKELRDISVDLLLVDGPPAFKSATTHSRYPAGPFFKPMLSERCCIILDDVNRPAEQEIVCAWQDELQITFEDRLLKGNISIGVRGQAFSI